MSLKRNLTLGLVIFTSFASGAWLLQARTQEAQESTGGDVYQKARLLENIINYISTYYVDSIDAADLYNMAIDGMLEKLDDPYTDYLNSRAYGDLKLSTTGNYAGVGIRIAASDGWITVVTPLADTPAERAGIVSGDQIVAVNGESTRGWSVQQASGKMRGKPGTPVELTIVRAGLTDTLHFRINRARIHVNSVEGPMVLSDGVAYVRIRSISRTASRELRQAVSRLRTEGARALILDLRNNPGGILEEGVALADLFLDSGEVVVETRGQAQGSSETYHAVHPEAWPGMPVVVLVNEGTASAAEILSGALQDHHRALVLGTRTFGKGVAYLLIRLSDSEALSVTSSRWYTPAGRSIDRPRHVRHTSGAAQVAVRNEPAATDSSATAAGGIVPDIALPPDTLTEAESRFARELGADIPVYRDVITAYALELKGKNAVTEPGFAVTRAMTDELLRRLKERGVNIKTETWRQAEPLIRDQFGYELTRYAFGRSAELRRRALDDNQVKKAIELLSTSRTVEQLIAKASKN